MDSLPEELLERILGLTLPSPKSIDILCVSSTFYRVALPLVYRTVKLRSASSCQKLLEHPDAPSVRPHTLVITHSALYSPLLPAVLTRYGSNVEEVDITMTMPIFDNKRDNAEDIKALCEALAGLHRIKRFTLRKAPGMPFYLGAPWVKDFVAGLAQALSGGQRWNSLVCSTLSVDGWMDVNALPISLGICVYRTQNVTTYVPLSYTCMPLCF